MQSDRAKLFARLEELGIAATTVEHAPMFTVEQSQALRGTIPGAHTKNLFLKDKDGRMVLVVAKEDTCVDLKALAQRLGLGRFSFGKPALLQDVLGIEPGSVTAFALINETSAADCRRGRGRGADGLRRGQLPSLGQQRDDADRHQGLGPIHGGLRP